MGRIFDYFMTKLSTLYILYNYDWIIHYFIYFGRFLMASGALLEITRLAKRDRKEANGLLDAVIAQDVPRVTHLLAIGVNPDARIDNAHPCSVKGWKDGDCALSIAIFAGNIPIARLLLEAGASTELVGVKEKTTALMYAAVMNNLEGAQLLVEWSAKLNAVNKVGLVLYRNKNGQQILSYAARR